MVTFLNLGRLDSLKKGSGGMNKKARFVGCQFLFGMTEGMRGGYRGGPPPGADSASSGGV